MNKTMFRCLNDVLLYCNHPQRGNATSCDKKPTRCKFALTHSDIGPTEEDILLISKPVVKKPAKKRVKKTEKTVKNR